MIEKIHSHFIKADDGDIIGIMPPSTSEIVDKLNEIIDVVNSFEVTRDIGYEKAIEDIENLLRCRNYPGCASGKGCDGICRINSDICKNCENFGIPYLLLADWKKGIKNE